MAKKTMKKIGRRGLAVLMMLVMAFSLLQITALAADMNCGKTEHSHSEACYTVIEHEHGDEASECYSDHVHTRWCDSVNHVHSTETCAYELHAHSEACYASHEHDRSCYGYICGEEESRRPGGHRHGRECYGIVCELEGTDELVCGLGDGEIVYDCDIRFEYPDCPARDFSCGLVVGENTVNICGLDEHSHSKACYPSGTYTFDHIDIRVKASDYHLVLGNDSYDLTIAFSADAADTFSVTVPTGGKSDDGKTHTVSPSGYENQEGEFRLLGLALSDYHQPSEFRISGTVLVLKSQVDALPEVLRAEFESLPTATYEADEVYSASSNDGGVYYRLTLNNYVPSANVCTGWGNTKGYDFNITPEAILTPITDFVVVNKVVVNEAGQVISDDQSFDFTLGNISGQVGSPISLKGGESDSFSGLTSGLYTVTESAVDGYKPVAYDGSSWTDALYVQEVQSVSKVDGTAGSVTFYNMKLVDKGSLKVSKAVTGTAASGYNGSYSFEIKDAGGETVATMTLANGQSQEIIVPAGSYTVTETGAAANGTDVLTVSANQTELELGDEGYTAAVTVGKAESVSLVFNNNYDAYVQPPVEPETEEWTIIHNYYLDGTNLEGSTSSTVEVEAGQQPVLGIDYAREYTYNGNVYVDLGNIVVDDASKTITLEYNRETPVPPAPQTESWTIVHNYYLDSITSEGSTTNTVEVEVGQQPVLGTDYAREYSYNNNIYVDLGNIVVDDASKTITLEYNRETPYVPSQPPVIDPVVIYYTLTVNWVDEDGNALDVQSVQTLPAYSGYNTVQKSFEGYSFVQTSGDAVSGVMNSNKAVTYIYKLDEIVEIPDEEPPLVDIPDEEPPLVDIPEEDVPLVDIPDEDVPMADVPKTGDSLALYVILAVLSGLSLAALALTGKKKTQK